MALPIAHATAGYLVHRLDRRRGQTTGWLRVLAFLVMGNLPDIDFLFGFLVGRPGAFHRGITHTVVAAVVFGLAAGTFVWWRRLDRWWPATLLCAAAYGSHLLVDAFTIDQRGPAGAQFFWPFSDAYYISPVTIFGEILIDGGSRQGFIWSIVAWPTVRVLAHEALLAGLALGSLRVWDVVSESRSRAKPIGELAAGGEEDLA